MTGDVKSRRDEHSEATRSALLSAARELLGKHGYNGTSIEMVASAARVTTGAIYHHFQNKKDLFLATAEALQEELLAEATSVSGASRWEQYRNGYNLLVERFSNPAVHRILFVEAPQVIGPGPWREIELRYIYGTGRDMLESFIRKKIIRNFPAGLLARMLTGLLRESCAELAESGNDPRVRAQVNELIDRVFQAIRTNNSP